MLFYFTSHAQIYSNGYSLKSLQIHYNDVTAPYVINSYTVVPDKINSAPAANTGLAYDPVNHYLFVSEYLSNYTSRILVLSRTNQLVRAIDVTPHLNFIQGLAYVPQDSSFWVWGTRKGYSSAYTLEDPNNPGFSLNHYFFHISSTGSLIESFPTPIDAVAPGTLEYKAEDNSLWVRPYDRQLLFNFSLTDWTQNRKIAFSNTVATYHGEGNIEIKNNNTFITANHADIFIFDSLGNIVSKRINPTDNGQVEGMFLDPTDSTIWMNADEYFHGYIPNGNKVWHINFFNTYNKDVYFPNMFHWNKGKIVENLQINGDELLLTNNADSGIWVSPIIDFAEYQPLIKNFETNAFLKYEFRGSNTPPTIVPDTNFTLDYFNSNLNNEGWGNTIPSSWSETQQNYRFLQIRITMKSAVVVNELMPNFGNTILDENFDADDWFELYNRTNKPVDLSEMSFAIKNGGEIFNFSIPKSNDNSHILQANEFQQFWADNEPAEGWNHLNFTLKQQSFTHPLLFNERYSTISLGNFPDGADNLIYMLPTPQNQNTDENIPPFRISETEDVTIQEDCNETIIATNIAQHFNDIDGSELLTISAINILPGVESLTINPENNNLSLLPENNFSGVTEIVIFAQDAEQGIASDTLTVIIQNVNDPPIANNDSYELNEDQTLSVAPPAILSNDYDIELQQLQSILIIPPQNGNATIATNGQISYTPNLNFFGNDTLEYLVTDGALSSGLANVVFVVAPVNDSPQSNLPQLISFLEDEATSINLENYISDVDNTFETLQINWSGNIFINVERNGNILNFNTLVENWNGTENVNFIISDGTATIYHTLTVKCLPVNDSPLFEPPFEIAFKEDEISLVYDFRNYFSDIDNTNNELTLTWSNSVNVNIIRNEWLFQFSNSDENWFGNETLEFSITDGENTVSKNINFICQAVNDSPTIAMPDTIIIQEDNSLIFEFQSHISDIDNSLNDLFISWEGNTFISIESFNYELLINPTIPNWIGQEEVVFFVTDLEFSLSDTVLIICENVNDAPTLSFPQNFQFNEDEFSEVFNFLQYVSDIDNNSGELSIQWFGNENIAITQNFWDFSFYSTQENWFGSENITLVISDGQNQVTTNITIHCQPVNDLPYFTNNNPIVYNEDEAVNINFAPFVNDVDNSIDELFLSWQNNQNVNILFNQWNLNFSSIFENWFGEEVIQFYLTDGQETVLSSFTIQCNAVNDPPVVQFPVNFSLPEDGQNSYNFTEYIYDIDNEMSDLMISWTGNYNININRSEWDITFTSNVQNWTGSENVMFIVTDGIDDVFENVDVNCIQQNDYPSIFLPEYFSVNEDEQLVVNFAQYISDIENATEQLFLSWENPEFYNIYQNNMQISFAPNSPDWNGSEFVTFTVTDFGFLSATDQTEIITLPVNDLPNSVLIYPLENVMFVEKDTSLHFKFTADDIDSELNHSWFINNVAYQSAVDEVNITFNEIGIFEVKCNIAELDTTMVKTWTVVVDEYDRVMYVLKDETINFQFPANNPEISQNYSWFVNDNSINSPTDVVDILFDNVGVFNIKCSINEEIFNYETFWTIFVDVDNLEAFDDIQYQNYPNPFINKSIISFYINKPEQISVTVHDINGRYITTLIPQNTRLENGQHYIEWNGTNINGGTVSAGIYFYKLQTETTVYLKKAVFLGNQK